MTEKVVSDGMVAILISPGYGAGWSTRAHDEHEDFAKFDPGLIRLAEDGATEEAVKNYIKQALGADSYFYTGGWRDIEVVWLPQGTAFRIEEYDGAESLTTRDDMTTA